MIVTSNEKKYVAIVFAGSDDVKNWITDFDLTLSKFGPPDNPIANVRVHSGFNHAVFDEGLYDEIRSTAKELLRQNPGFRFYISGHSLGAADSILTGAAMAHNDTSLRVTVINYGCPKIGRNSWKDFANGLPNLEIWRLVHRDDIVPRVPNARDFMHVGHTVQLKKRNKAITYYLHYGDKTLGYRGVPWDWESEALSSPTSSYHHTINNYVDYISKYAAQDPDPFFFAKTKKAKGDNTTDLPATVI